MSDKLHPVETLLTRPPQSSEDNWILPYLDVFILLTMMFIVLLSMSSMDLVKQDDKLQQQQQANQKLQAEIEPLRQIEMEGRSSLVLEYWQERVNQVLDSLKLKDDIALSLEDEFVKLEIQDRMLFDSASAQLKPSGQELLRQLKPVLEMAAGTIVIEGHTDNLPIETNAFPSNWELGAARAASVVRAMVETGMNQQRFRAVSYADTRPTESNENEAGRQKNRRVAMLLRMPDRQD